MIGVKKRVIIFSCMGWFQSLCLTQSCAKSGPYQTEEACLSLAGSRSTTRYQEITVDYLDRNWQTTNHNSEKLSGSNLSARAGSFGRNSYIGRWNKMKVYKRDGSTFYFIGFLLLWVSFYYGFWPL